MKMKLSKSAGEYFEEGIELFNQGRFFACHESWEEVWKQAHGEERLFYQGLIQAAVAILHAQRGNREGARSLYAKARAKLDSVAPEHTGLAIGKLRDDLAAFFKIVLSEQPRVLPRPPRLHRASAQPRH